MKEQLMICPYGTYEHTSLKFFCHVLQIFYFHTTNGLETCYQKWNIFHLYYLLDIKQCHLYCKRAQLHEI